MQEKLTVLIPTFNRKDYLRNCIQRLKEQSCDCFNIFVSDNDSDYDIYSLIDEFPSIKERITVFKRQINVGADYNIINLFLMCNTKYAWILSDDDEIEYNAVEKIYSYIEQNREFGCLNFSLSKNMPYVDGKIEIDNVDNFTKLYAESYKRGSEWHGDLIFLSNKIYNMEQIAEVLPWLIKYDYSKIGSAILIAKCAEYGKKYIIINDQIVNYNPTNERSWNAYYVILGSRVIGDISFSVNAIVRKKLLRGLAFGIENLLFLCFVGEKEYPGYKTFFDQIYHGLYKYILPFPSRIKLKIIVLICKGKWGYVLLRKMYSFKYKVRHYLYIKRNKKG